MDEEKNREKISGRRDRNAGGNEGLFAGGGHDEDRFVDLFAGEDRRAGACSEHGESCVVHSWSQSQNQIPGSDGVLDGEGLHEDRTHFVPGGDLCSGEDPLLAEEVNLSDEDREPAADRLLENRH